VLLLLIAFFINQAILFRGQLYLILAVEHIPTCIPGWCRYCNKHLRRQGAVRGSTFLICRSEDREKLSNFRQEKLLQPVGWADVNSLAADVHSLDATLEHIYHLGVAEVFICSWQSIKSRMFLYWKLRAAGITLHILPIELERLTKI